MVERSLSMRKVTRSILVTYNISFLNTRGKLTNIKNRWFIKVQVAQVEERSTKDAEVRIFAWTLKKNPEVVGSIPSPGIFN